MALDGLASSRVAYVLCCDFKIHLIKEQRKDLKQDNEQI